MVYYTLFRSAYFFNFDLVVPDDIGRVQGIPAVKKVKNHWIKLCPRGAQTCALPLFCDSDLEINPVTLKHEGDLDILKM